MIVEPGVHERLAATCICICSVSLMIIQTVPRNQAKPSINQRTSPAGHWACPFIDDDTKLVLPPTRRNRPKLPCTEALQSGHRPLWYVKNKKDTDLSISSPRWPQHRSCILGLAQRLEGSNGMRTNFVLIGYSLDHPGFGPPWELWPGVWIWMVFAH